MACVSGRWLGRNTRPWDWRGSCATVHASRRVTILLSPRRRKTHRQQQQHQERAARATLAHAHVLHVRHLSSLERTPGTHSLTHTQSALHVRHARARCELTTRAWRSRVAFLQESVVQVGFSKACSAPRRPHFHISVHVVANQDLGFSGQGLQWRPLQDPDRAGEGLVRSGARGSWTSQDISSFFAGEPAVTSEHPAVGTYASPPIPPSVSSCLFGVRMVVPVGRWWEYSGFLDRSRLATAAPMSAPMVAPTMISTTAPMMAPAFAGGANCTQARTTSPTFDESSGHSSKLMMEVHLRV